MREAPCSGHAAGRVATAVAPVAKGLSQCRIAVSWPVRTAQSAPYIAVSRREKCSLVTAESGSSPVWRRVRHIWRQHSRLRDRRNETAAAGAGTLNLPVTGGYKFCLGSDDGAQLRIDGARVIDNGGAVRLPC